MRVLVLGGSGKVGRHVVRQAVARGHEVVALVRPTTAFDPPPGVEVVRDEVLREGALDAVIPGANAVISSIGIQRARLDPWSKVLSPPDLCSRSAALLVSAMRRAGVPRVVAVSSAGVGDSFPRMNVLMRVLVARSNLGVAYADLERMEQVYRESGLDWVCVRPVRLHDGPPTGRVREVESFGALDGISRADVAGWLLDRLERAAPGRTPQIAA